MTFIIFEGCDGVGKTHIVNELAWHVQKTREQMPLVLHRGPPHVHPLVEYELALEVLYDAEPNRVVICDRWHWGELVYGPLYRNGSLLDRPGKLHIDMWLAARGGAVFEVIATEDEILKRLRGKGESYLREEHISHVVKRYHDIRMWPSPVTRKTIHSGDILQVLATPFTDIRPHPSYVGPPKPTGLLVADRRHKLNESTHRATLVPYSATSGRFILEALPTYLYESVGLINSDPREVPDLREEWKRLGEPRCIALGAHASRFLNDVGITHGVVPHPQYVRRFHHAKALEYGELISRVIATQEDRRTWPS